MEPSAPNAISYDTRPATYYTNYWLVQIKSSTVLDCFLASIIVNNISSYGVPFEILPRKEIQSKPT